MIFVFKTNVKSKKQINEIAPLLDSMPEIKGWNFDLDDCDKILRIQSHKGLGTTIPKMLGDLGFECIELY